jgi:hypothetical protein
MTSGCVDAAITPRRRRLVLGVAAQAARCLDATSAINTSRQEDTPPGLEEALGPGVNQGADDVPKAGGVPLVQANTVRHMLRSGRCRG